MFDVVFNIGLSLSIKAGFIRINESSLKTKNVFNFILKAIFVLTIFELISWIFGHVGKRLKKNLRLISKFITSQEGKQIIAIHILPNISNSKDNQTKKFSNLIEYSMEIFVSKNYAQNTVEKLVQNPFIKKLSILLD